MHQQPPQTPLFATTSAAKSSQVSGVSRRVVYWVTADVTVLLSSCSRPALRWAAHQARGLAVGDWRAQATFDDPNPLPSGASCVNADDVLAPPAGASRGDGSKPSARGGHATARARAEPSLGP